MHRSRFACNEMLGISEVVFAFLPNPFRVTYERIRAKQLSMAANSMGDMAVRTHLLYWPVVSSLASATWRNHGTYQLFLEPEWALS